jgi:predicted NUDIX family NTP pyrophosphohydrolase
MLKRISSGILLYKIIENQLFVFLVHPGGPFFKNKNDGHWGIPKGEIHNGEDYLTCALREVKEEIGLSVENKNLIPLGSIVQKGGKTVYAWAYEQKEEFVVNTSGSIVEMQWPPVFGKQIKFPEIDKAEYFSIQNAQVKIKSTQMPFIERLEDYLREKGIKYNC